MQIEVNQSQVRQLLAEGLSLADVAEILSISRAEVETLYEDAVRHNIHEVSLLENKKVTMIPLLEEQLMHYLDGNCVAMENDRAGRFLWQFSSQQELPRLELGKIYAALRTFFGAGTAEPFDSYKMSFLFPFLLKIEKDGFREEFEYLLLVQDFKGWLEFPFFRIVKSEEREVFKDGLYAYHKPFDEELTREEMDEIVGYIGGYIEGVTANISEWYDEDFSHYVEAIRLKYGFEDGHFYQYEDVEEQ